jgi:hypothetical protein
MSVSIPIKKQKVCHEIYEQKHYLHWKLYIVLFIDFLITLPLLLFYRFTENIFPYAFIGFCCFYLLWLLMILRFPAILMYYVCNTNDYYTYEGDTNLLFIFTLDFNEDFMYYNTDEVRHVIK